MGAALPDDGWNARLDELYDAAIGRFGATCLWNARPSRTKQGMRVVAERLRLYGNMAAWRLAAEIGDELGRASG